MFAVYAAEPKPDDPLAALVVGERPAPQVPPGHVAVKVRAASLNMHDVWTLRGVGIRAEKFPLILGLDGAGVTDDGREVVIHSVIPSPGWRGDETLDPQRSMLTERYQGTFAETVVVPAANVLPKPASMSFSEAACMGTAWLTAYRMRLLELADDARFYIGLVDVLVGMREHLALTSGAGEQGIDADARAERNRLHACI